MQKPQPTIIPILSEARPGIVISHYFGAFIFVFILFLISLLVVCLLRTKWPKLLTEKYKTLSVIIGVGLLLVATIGRLGWSIQTFDGNTLGEKLNIWIFWIISCLGTFLLFVDTNDRLFNGTPSFEAKIQVVITKTVSTTLEMVKRTRRWLPLLWRKR